ncbi:MAG TPA: molybdopterin converting factor subunit 1 [Acidiferrobacterales bacterium]
MTPITVRFFASIREDLGKDEEHIDSQGIATAADVWERVAGRPLPARTLVAVNQQYASPGHPVKAGDEVAFFPPVTGGELP